MSVDRHDDLAVETTSPHRDAVQGAREKRKSPTPSRDDQGAAKKSEKRLGEQSKAQQPNKFRKKYVYTSEDKRRKIQKDYQGLREIHQYLTGSQFPPRIQGGTARFNFKRRAKAFTLYNGELYLKRKHQPCRVLWEHEVLSSLEKCHQEWAHYPKTKENSESRLRKDFSFLG